MQIVEMCCLSQPAHYDSVLECERKYGSIFRLWFGPYLAVVLTEAKYVEVSKLVLAVWAKHKRQNVIF